MTAARILAMLVVVSGVAGAAPEAPEARYAPKGLPGVRPPVSELAGVQLQYLYVPMAELPATQTAGAGATILQADPALGIGDFHTLAEIAAETRDNQQVVEIGWTIDFAVNGDLQPHLFAFHWVNGQPTCYNACGWVQVSSSKRPGMRVVPGEAHRYEIKLVNSDWWLFYDGEGMGYYPQSLWGGSFTQSTLVQWFGEVAAAVAAPCTQMGNGKLGADSASTTFEDLHLFEPGGATVPAVATARPVTSPTLYDIGRVTATSFGFGGPGAATGCCRPSSCLAVHAECGSIADPACAGNTLPCGSCNAPDVCTIDHTCGVGPPLSDDVALEGPIDRSGGGCCDAGPSGPSGPGALVLGVLVALGLGRRRARGNPAVF